MTGASRTASCACGALVARTRGEPDGVAACNCTQCQRRTGSVFGVNAYFPAGQVQIEGESKAFERRSQRGRRVTFHFCPSCGTSVYFTGEFAADIVGVPVGCFADPDFPPPERAVWTGTRHGWVEFPAQCELFEEQKG